MSRYRIDIERDVVLVLTASIDTKSMWDVSRPDPELREDDYAASLSYYLKNHPRVRRIVFIENSAWPLDRLKQIAARDNPHGKEVEFLSLDLNDFPRELGKSYGELLLMDKGINTSRLCRDAKYIAKITGRNFLLNLTTILERVRRPFALLCDLRDHGIYEMFGMKACGRHADTRFFVFTREFFHECIEGQYAHERERNYYFIENLIYDQAKTSRFADRAIRRLPVEPNFRGLAGHGANKDYGSFRETAKRRIRATARRVVPWLHI